MRDDPICLFVYLFIYFKEPSIESGDDEFDEDVTRSVKFKIRNMMFFVQHVLSGIEGPVNVLDIGTGPFCGQFSDSIIVPIPPPHYMLNSGFFILSILADRYIWRRKRRVVWSENLSSVDCKIETNVSNFIFFEESSCLVINSIILT